MASPRPRQRPLRAALAGLQGAVVMAAPLPKPCPEDMQAISQRCLYCAHGGIYGGVCARCGLCQVCDEFDDDCQCETPAEERFLQALLEVAD